MENSSLSATKTQELAFYGSPAVSDHPHTKKRETNVFADNEAKIIKKGTGRVNKVRADKEDNEDFAIGD